MAKIHQTTEQYRLLKLAECLSIEGDAAGAGTLISISDRIGELETDYDGYLDIVELDENGESEIQPI